MIPQLQVRVLKEVKQANKEDIEEGLPSPVCPSDDWLSRLELVRKEIKMGCNSNTCQSSSGPSFGCVLAYGAALGFGVAGEIFRVSPNPQRRLKAPILKEFSKLAENLAKVVC